LDEVPKAQAVPGMMKELKKKRLSTGALA